MPLRAISFFSCSFAIGVELLASDAKFLFDTQRQGCKKVFVVSIFFLNLHPQRDPKVLKDFKDLKGLKDV